MRDAWIAVDRGRVAALSRRGPTDGSREVDLGDVVVLPGLVNAHTHLELSYLREEIPPASRFVSWVQHLIQTRRTHPDPAAPEVLDAVDRAVAESIAYGTAIVGDISNTLVTFEPLTKSELAAVVFYELIRFKTDDPQGVVEKARADLDALVPTQRVRASLAAHAPYSVAPLVLRAIRKDVERDPFAPASIHLSESVEELEFIRDGGGPWRALLEQLGAWEPSSR